jgi:long-chain acyl-CoA synthetase
VISPAVEDEAATAARPVFESSSARASLGTVLGTLEERLRRHWRRPALAIRRDGHWLDLTFDDVAMRSLGHAGFLVALGAQRGDRVAILARSSPEWGLWFFGSVMAGATVVPLDPTLTAHELEGIMRDCEPHFVLVAADRLHEARAIAEAIGGHIRVESIEAEPVGWDAAGPSANLRAAAPWPRPRTAEEIALIVYTSGTMGEPKGVMIPFRALLFEVGRLEEAMQLHPGECFLSVLPLNHTLELTGGFLSVLAVGGSVCYASSLLPDDLRRDLCERRVSGMIGVPLLLRALQRGVEQRVRALPAIARSAYRLSWIAAGVLPWRRARRWLFAPLHAQLGGRLRLLVCGGAPLDPELERWFDRVGIVVLQGYGLTETGPVISVNTHRRRRIGSVGQPLAGIEVRIASDPDPDGGDDAILPDGEILTRGPHVMHGYFRRPEETSAVLDADGWLRTGDRGRQDRDGYLYITGRVKSLIVLGGGKKVQPEEVEAALARSPQIEEVCVVGRHARRGLRAGTEQVCAVVVPAASLRASFGGDAGALRNALRVEIERLGTELAAYKRPAVVLIREHELPKTASRKVRRSEVYAWADGVEDPA